MRDIIMFTLGVTDVLIGLPMDSVGRYEQFLDDYGETTEHDHVEKELLDKATEAMIKEVCIYYHRVIRELLELLELSQLLSRVIYYGYHHIKSH